MHLRWFLFGNMHQLAGHSSVERERERETHADLEPTLN